MVNLENYSGPDQSFITPRRAMIVPAVPEYVLALGSSSEVPNDLFLRIVEEEIESAIESRNEALQTIRELGPPDLVHLVKQTKSGGRQVPGSQHF